MQTHSLAEFQAAAAEITLGLTPRSERAVVVALSGDLGAGKTTFVQAAAAALSVAEIPKSPTFVVMQLYPIPTNPRANGFTQLVHIDAYRLEGKDQLKVLHWEELCSNPHNLIFIEWPEMVEGGLPGGAKRITLRHIDENTREITLEEPASAGGVGEVQ